VERHAGRRYSLLWSDGSVSLVEVRIEPEFDAAGRRTDRCIVETLADAGADAGQPTEKAILRKSDSGTTTCVRLLSDGQIVASRQVTTENLLGEKQTRSQALHVEDSGLGPIRAFTVSRDGGTLYVGTEKGELGRWQYDEDGQLTSSERFTAFEDRRRITALAMVFGDASLAVGDSCGVLSTWFPVRLSGRFQLTKIHTLTPHHSGVRQILPTVRDKSLLSLAEDGSIHVDHMTSERHLVALDGGRAVEHVAFAPRGDALVSLQRDGTLSVWNIDRAYAEVSARTLFGKVHYEGYDGPSYAWQTTGGEDFEPKLSLVPLISGTLKGTLYAMLLAAPLALLGAIYVSHFTTPGVNSAIKPVVEIMAALPSVVIGFLVALWLAPLLERWILAVFLSLLTLPATFVFFMLFWQWARRFGWAKRLEVGHAFLVLLPVIVFGIALAAYLRPAVESLLFEGDFRLWLYDSLSMRYDQRNCIVIAAGLGLAVIPIIFSIAEDSLSSVPRSLAAASLALGASRWQTVWRVVVPSASPGIFAGVMIGFGRAVGETMIVLMATGNTPILDWSPFTGMRTLSANIAVEIPEAPVGGTLYRVLFLCAVLLFLLTFALNTAAELVRQRLRLRYGRL
jgi:phosphate transport system permease protein